MAQRNYNVDGQVGLESTIAAYVATIVGIMGDVRRVMRPDATLWLNLGDKYNGSGGAGGDYDDEGIREGQPTFGSFADPTLPAKSLCMVPARVAIAMQADGWILRSEITWAKKATMPQSVTDRPTSATERIYLFAKQGQYFYDRFGFQEPGQDWGPRNRTNGKHHGEAFADASGMRPHKGLMDGDASAGRNIRDFWLLGPEPFAGEHHAVFVSEIPRRAILLGTSAKGACGAELRSYFEQVEAECGAPWDRTVEKHVNISSGPRNTVNGKGLDASDHRGAYPRATVAAETTGWQPRCSHAADTVPCTVLDPFACSGTTLAVAKQLGRRSIGIELSEAYCALAVKRIGAVTLPMAGLAG